MNKAVWLSTVILALFAVNDGQAISINYPSKKMLQKADHGLSLAITAGLISGIITDGNSPWLRDYEKHLNMASLYLLFSATGTNIMVNALALKHERTMRSLLRLLLPTAILGGSINGHVYGQDVSDPAAYATIAGFAVNGIKNIWDVNSLIRSEQSKGIQND